ncbi:MAG: cysteine hydrolase family protein, partial [Candidatus Brocadiia bacterium]|nr:cysteine hydrolase family protein [Candidatus Brocadiia bacterium]
MLKLSGRCYRTIPLTDMRYVFEPWELDPAKTALVAMHCWNIGCEDGPAVDPNYCVGMASYEAAAEAGRIIRECIRPAMDACRRAGVAVVHVENDSIAAKHPEAQEEAEKPPAATGTRPPSVVPGWRAGVVAKVHGADYATESPYARMDRARLVAPEPGEIYAYQTGQLDRLLRRRGIENLVYCGFATDMCVLRAAGGIEPMAGYDYRLFLLRDATVGVEFP